MRTSSEKHSKMGNVVVLAIPIVFIAFCIWGTLRLISEGNYYSATGGGLASILITFFLILRFIKPKQNTLSNIRLTKPRHTATIHEGDELVLLYSSKDIVRITQIEQALRTRGIDCTVLDRHGSAMMSFIPDIEMRIIVPREDYEWSVQIMNELTD